MNVEVRRCVAERDSDEVDAHADQRSESFAASELSRIYAGG